MPDPTRQTISATQSAALFGVSPYVTRWMLWHHFARGLDIDPPEDSRMSWGKKLEPLVLQQAAEDMRLEVQPNVTHYHRRGLLGCTRDATIICPDRGPGALETKCVFDYRIWMQDWQGGKTPPRHHEIQLQQQMLVGDGATPFAWGMIAAWVCGEVYYFERKPIEVLWSKLHQEAACFFGEVKDGREPEPFGAPVELPWLTQLFPTVAGNPLDLSGAPDAEKLAEVAVQYRDAKDLENGGARAAEPLRAKLLALAKNHDEIILPAGVRVRISARGKGKMLKVYVPDGSTSAAAIPIEEVMYAG